MRLNLTDAVGAPTTSIRACRAAAPWSELAVAWAFQPFSTLPCAVTTVGAAPGFYGWDVTEFVTSLQGTPEQNFGFVLQNLNELQLNERAFASRQHPAPLARPQLLVQYVRVPMDIDAEFSLQPTAEGDRIRLFITPLTSEEPIYELELFFAEQQPRWTTAEILSSPIGWASQVTTAPCEFGPSQSGLVRFSTESSPLMQDQPGEFEVRVRRTPTIETEIVQMQLVSMGGGS